MTTNKSARRHDRKRSEWGKKPIKGRENKHNYHSRVRACVKSAMRRLFMNY